MSAPDHEIRVGVLAGANALAFASDFQLGHWQGLEHQGFGCPDAGAQSFAFGSDRAESSCTTTPLTTAQDAWLPRLYASGSPIAGPIRYWVREATTDAWPQRSPELALSYPFGDASDIASAPNQPPKTQTSPGTGVDGSVLRGLRGQYETAPHPVPAPSFSIPVKDDNGSFYDFALRDTVPFEVDGKLAIDAFIR